MSELASHKENVVLGESTECHCDWCKEHNQETRHDDLPTTDENA